VNKLTRKSIIPFIIIISFIVVIGYLYTDTNASMFAAFFDDNRLIYEPTFLHGECVPIEGINKELHNWEKIPNSGKFYECNINSAGTWIPKGTKCEFEISGFGFTTIRLCDMQVTETKSCINPSPFTILGDNEIFKVEQGKKLWVKPIVAYVKFRGRYPAYGLKILTPNNYLFATTTTCEVQSLSNNYHLEKGESSNIVDINRPINIIHGFQEVYSRSVVTIPELNNGNPIYIIDVNKYYPILETEDKVKYVDINNLKTNTRIECVPGIGCTTEARKETVEGQKCDALGGTPVGYVRKSDDTTTECTYKCVNKNNIPDKCRKVKICSGETPVWDSINGKCIGLGQKSKSESDLDLIPFIIIGGFVILTLLIIYIRGKNQTGGGF